MTSKTHFPNTKFLILAYHTVGLGAALEAFLVTIVVGAGELTAADWVLAAAGTEPDFVGELTAESVGVLVAGAGVLDAGVNEGVVAVHLGQMVTVSVVRNVETLVMYSIEVWPCLVWVFVDTGQLVTVV